MSPVKGKHQAGFFALQGKSPNINHHQHQYFTGIRLFKAGCLVFGSLFYDGSEITG